MTVSTTTSRTSYTGNGITTAFAFPYKFTQNSDLVVLLVDANGISTEQVLTTHYTVSGAGTDSSGQVTMITAPASTETLVIYRDTDITQETDYIVGDAFPAETHESALDKLTLITQEIQTAVNRAVRLPDSSSVSSITMAEPFQAGQYLKINAAGDGIEYNAGTNANQAAAVETQTLASGQTSVVFTSDVSPAAFYLSGPDVDSGRLTLGDDYTVNAATKTVTLTQSYPAGTKLVMVYVDGAADLYSVSSGEVSYAPSGTGAVTTTVEAKLRETVSVKDFGAVGDGVTDDTAAIQAALNTNKSVYFPEGVYLTDPLLIPVDSKGSTYFGDGYYHYDRVTKTVIKAKTASQAHVFSLASGADNITFEHLRIDGDDKASKCIDATFGAFFAMENCGVYNYVDFGVYSKQGLGRYSKCFFSTSTITNPTAVGLHLYSDSSVTDSEFSGGATPLKLVAGGNRLVNIWANTGTENCIHLVPFDASTTHINTSLINIYAGEVLGGAVSKPIIHLEGNATQKVQQVQISNSHLVSAAGNPDPKINGGIRMEYCLDTSISNITYFGNGSGATATRYTDYFIKTSNCENTNITGCSVYNVNKNPFFFSTSSGRINVSGCGVREFGTGSAGQSGTEFAAIRNDGAMATVTGCTFDIAGSETGPYAAYTSTASLLNFVGNTYRYPNATVINSGSGTATGIYKTQSGGTITLANVGVTGSTITNTTVNNAKQNYLSRGQISAGASSTTTLTTLATLAENQSYLISVRQSGSGGNSVIGYVMAHNTSVSAIRMAQSNTPGGALDMNLTTSGNAIQLVLGSGFGTTTWDWVITRLG